MITVDDPDAGHTGGLPQPQEDQLLQVTLRRRAQFSVVREAAKKVFFFSGLTTKRGGGFGPDH